MQDGYAVRAADGMGEFEVDFSAVAGTVQGSLPAGKVAYIGTGGPLPQGADAVVQIEDTQPLDPGLSGKPRVQIIKVESCRAALQCSTRERTER